MATETCGVYFGIIGIVRMDILVCVVRILGKFHFMVDADRADSCSVSPLFSVWEMGFARFEERAGDGGPFVWRSHASMLSQRGIDAVADCSTSPRATTDDHSKRSFSCQSQKIVLRRSADAIIRIDALRRSNACSRQIYLSQNRVEIRL